MPGHLLLVSTLCLSALAAAPRREFRSPPLPETRDNCAFLASVGALANRDPARLGTAVLACARGPSKATAKDTSESGNAAAELTLTLTVEPDAPLLTLRTSDFRKLTAAECARLGQLLEKHPKTLVADDGRLSATWRFRCVNQAAELALAVGAAKN